MASRRSVVPYRHGGTGHGRSERFDTVVIGAGQAGLSAGYLPAAGWAVVRDPGRERAGRRLVASALRLAAPVHPAALHRPAREPVPVEGRAHARRRTRWPTTSRRTPPSSTLPVRSGVRVDGVRREGEHYLVTAGPTTFEADNVIVATALTASRASRRSRTSSTRRSCSCTRASTATRRSSATAASWWWVPATRAPTSRSSCRARTRRGSRAPIAATSRRTSTRGSRDTSRSR